MSGYRDKDNLNVVITTDYKPSIQEGVYLSIILNRNEILTATKVYIDQLNKFLSDENVLYKQIVNSYKNNDKVLILLKNNFFYLGEFSRNSVVNKRVLKDFGVVKFDITHMGRMISKNINFEVDDNKISQCGRSLSNLVSNETIIRIDEISMLHIGNNIESIFYSLIENNNYIEIEREKVWSEFSKLDGTL